MECNPFSGRSRKSGFCCLFAYEMSHAARLSSLLGKKSQKWSIEGFTPLQLPNLPQTQHPSLAGKVRWLEWSFPVSPWTKIEISRRARLGMRTLAMVFLCTLCVLENSSPRHGRKRNKNPGPERFFFGRLTESTESRERPLGLRNRRQFLYWLKSDF